MTKNLLFSFLFFFIIFISNCSDKNNLKKYNDILNSGKFSGLSATEKQKLIETAITLKNYNNFALLIESTALNDLINLETKILKDVFIALIDLNELDALIKILDETKILDNQNFKIIYAELLIKTCEFTKLDLFLRGSSKHFQSADLQYLQKKYIQHFYSAEKHDNLLRCADILSHYVNLEIDEFLLVIDALINLNKYESAKYYCKRGLTAFKNNIKKEQIYYYYAKILAKEGDYSAAANYLDNLKSREFANSRNFILTLIEVYSNLPDKKDLLISEYNRLLNFELPKNIRLEILIKLMNYFENIKQYNLALKFANEITAIDKHNIQAHTIIIKYSEKPQRLIDSAQALLKIAPNDFYSLLALALFEYEQKNYEKSAEILEKLIKIKPFNNEIKKKLSDAYFNLAREISDREKTITKKTIELLTKSINHNINNFAAVRLLTNYYFHLKKYGEYLELSALLLCNGQLTEKEKILFLEVLANTNNKKLINDYISYTFDKFKNADKNISEQLIRILKLSENKELLLSYLQSQIFENKNLDNAIYHLKIYYDELPQTYEKLWILETLLNYDNLLTDQEKYKYLTALENRYYQKKEYFKYEKLIEKYGIEKFDKEKLLKLADETQNKKLIYILKKYFYDNLDKFETRLAIEYFKLFNDYNGIINILDKNPRYLKNNNIFIDYCEAILNTPDFQKILPKLKQLSTAQNTNDKIDMLIAKIFEKNGDFNTAHKYYSNIKKLNNPQVEIAKILTMQTDDEKKLEHLKNLYSANKNEKYIINALYNFYIALADKYTNSNNFKKSEELLNTALKLIPANHDAYLKLANIFILQNKNDAALKILQNAAQYLPNNKEILLTFAQLYKKSAIFDEFKKILTILFVLYPYDSEISNLLITNGYDDIIDELKTIKNLTIISEFIHNEYAAELKYLQNANLKKEIISDIISVLSKHQYLTQLHYPLARLFLTNNEYQNAATYLKQYNAKFEIVEAQYYEGLCALKLNKNIDALKILKKLYETNTDNYRALEIYTFALHKNFMADELKQLLKSIQPKKYKFLNFNLFIDIYSSLIAENIKNNKLSEIAELIEDSKKFGESEKIKILQAHLYYKQNDLKNLTNIIYELQPTNSKQYKICETLKKSVFKTKKIIDSVKYYNNGNYKASYEILKDIDANIFAANPDALHYYLITLFKNGLYEKCENILNYHYNNFDYRYKNTFLALLAQIQIIQKKLDAAIKTLSQFLDLDIKDKKIKYLLLADIYFKMKKYHYAIENYEAAISIEQNQNALFNLSMAYYLIGNNATAKDIIQHLSENSWDTKEIKEFKSILF